MYSAETASRIQQLRAKERDKTLTLEDMKEAAKILRADRQNAAITSKPSSKAPAGPKKSADEMLDELDSM